MGKIPRHKKTPVAFCLKTYTYKTKKRGSPPHAAKTTRYTQAKPDSCFLDRPGVSDKNKIYE